MKRFYFEVAAGSHAVVRNTTERPGVPFNQLSPVVTSYKAKGSCHSQEADTDAVKTQDASAPQGSPLVPYNS